MYPEPKLSRKQKLRELEKRIRNGANQDIDEILAKFSREYNVTQRHLREDYIKTLLLDKSIEPSDFKDSVLITKKFPSRLGMSQTKNEGENP